MIYGPKSRNSAGNKSRVMIPSSF